MIISLMRSVGTRRSNSAKIHPTAHMSTPTPYILAPNRSSGERYHLGKRSKQSVTLYKLKTDLKMLKLDRLLEVLTQIFFF